MTQAEGCIGGFSDVDQIQAVLVAHGREARKLNQTGSKLVALAGIIQVASGISLRSKTAFGH
jgi:hypothetical protein